MILALGVLAGLLTGLARKKSVERLATPGFRLLLLPVLGFAMQMVELLLYRWTGASPIRPLVVIGSYGLVAAFLLFNRSAGGYVALLGTLMNFAVIAANDFAMPISASVLRESPQLLTRQSLGYFIAQDGARLLPLGDVIRLDAFVFHGMFSAGDVLLALGAGIMVYQKMRQK